MKKYIKLILVTAAAILVVQVVFGIVDIELVANAFAMPGI